MKIEQKDYSKTSAYKIQTPGNYPEESIKHLKPDLQQSDSDTSHAIVK
jgi:hypothetical protein